MSAYLLSNEQFQKIANMMATSLAKEYYRYNTQNFLEIEYGTDPKEQVEAVTLMVRNLYNLNRLALVTRYGDTYERGDETRFSPKAEEFNPREYIDLLKSLRYQCGEYLASDTNLYKELDGYIGRLCESYFDGTR